MTDFKPVSKISIQKGSRYSDRKYDLDTDTIEAFENWIQMLKKYNAIEDTISKLYSNTFIKKENNYFDSRTQEQLNLFLEYVIEKLSESDDEKLSSIIEEFKDINKNRFILTKEVIECRSKNNFDKIKKYSLPLHKSIYNGVEKGIESIIQKRLEGLFSFIEEEDKRELFQS